MDLKESVDSYIENVKDQAVDPEAAVLERIVALEKKKLRLRQKSGLSTLGDLRDRLLQLEEEVAVLHCHDDQSHLSQNGASSMDPASGGAVEGRVGAAAHSADTLAQALCQDPPLDSGDADQPEEWSDSSDCAENSAPIKTSLQEDQTAESAASTSAAREKGSTVPLYTLPNALRYDIQLREDSVRRLYRAKSKGSSVVVDQSARLGRKVRQKRIAEITLKLRESLNGSASGLDMGEREDSDSDTDSINSQQSLHSFLSSASAAPADDLEFCVVEGDFAVLAHRPLPTPLVPPALTWRYPSIVNETVNNTQHVQDQSFFFPSGVQLEVVGAAVRDLRTQVFNYQRHVVPFSDRRGRPLYACCLTVSQSYPLLSLPAILHAPLSRLLLLSRSARRIQMAFRKYIVRKRSAMWIVTPKTALPSHASVATLAGAATASTCSDSHSTVSAPGSVGKPQAGFFSKFFRRPSVQPPNSTPRLSMTGSSQQQQLQVSSHGTSAGLNGVDAPHAAPPAPPSLTKAPLPSLSAHGPPATTPPPAPTASEHGHGEGPTPNGRPQDGQKPAAHRRSWGRGSTATGTPPHERRSWGSRGHPGSRGPSDEHPTGPPCLDLTLDLLEAETMHSAAVQALTATTPAAAEGVSVYPEHPHRAAAPLSAEELLLGKCVVAQKAYCFVSPVPEYTFLFTVLDAIAQAEPANGADAPQDGLAKRLRFLAQVSAYFRSVVVPQFRAASLQDLYANFTVPRGIQSSTRNAVLDRVMATAAMPSDDGLSNRLASAPPTLSKAASQRSLLSQVSHATSRSSAGTGSSDCVISLRGYGKAGKSSGKLRIDRSRLSTVKEWSLAVLLTHLSVSTVFKVINLLLLEKSLVVFGSHPGVVTAICTGVHELISPFHWEGLYIPLVPDCARELFSAPVPLIIGTVSPPRLRDVSEGTAVLCLCDDTLVLTPAHSSAAAAVQSPEQYTQKFSPALGVPSAEQLRLQEGDFQAYFSRLPEINADLLYEEDLFRRCGALRRSLLQYAMPHLHVCGSLPESKNSQQGTQTMRVKNALDRLLMSHVPFPLRQALRSLLMQFKRSNYSFVQTLLRDFNAYKKFIKPNHITKEEEFVPDEFLEPLRCALEFQEAVVHTQLFVSFVDKMRKQQRGVLQQVRALIGAWIYRQHLRRKRSREGMR